LGMPKGDRCFEKSQGSPHPRGVITERDFAPPMNTHTSDL
jgi:hypothetical protein